jgi:hypothetical protein
MGFASFVAGDIGQRIILKAIARTHAPRKVIFKTSLITRMKMNKSKVKMNKFKILLPFWPRYPE